MKNAPKTKAKNLLALNPVKTFSEVTDPQVHVISKKIICATDYRAHKRSPLSLVVDATEGFIPLWAENMVLRWKFNEPSLSRFQNPEAIKKEVRVLLTEAIAKWGDSAPIRFTEQKDNADFEIVVEFNSSCTPQGCTLAQAFFPDAGRHQLFVFPTMFEQSREEQVETMVHELGHVFGLRHFFAPDMETPWPSEIYGEHKPFSIMNYGDESVLTDADKNDLKKLYEAAWSGKLKSVNKTPIKLVRPFHYMAS